MSKNNLEVLNEYLASRHERIEKPIVEYFCSTCLLNQDLEKYSEFEKNHQQTFTPIHGRRVHDVGIIFTKDSAMAEFHFKHRIAHDWGLYQPFIRKNPSS